MLVVGASPECRVGTGPGCTVGCLSRGVRFRRIISIGGALLASAQREKETRDSTRLTSRSAQVLTLSSGFLPPRCVD